MDHASENITVNSTMEMIINHCKELYQQQIANNTVVGGFFAPIQNLLHGTVLLSYLFFHVKNKF